MLNYKIIKGFTIIELLIVIAIIGILSAMIGVSVNNYQKRARDTARKSDLSQYRVSLESFANRNSGLYPSRTSATLAATTLCTDLGLTTAVCAADPTDSGNYRYYYISDGSGSGGANATTFALYGYMESVTTNNYFVLCSSGDNLTKSSAPVLADCQ